MSTLDPKIESLLQEQYEKYWDLVWWGKHGQDTPHVDLEQRYPKEIAAFRRDPPHEHGFNCGCLAMVRLIMGATYVMSTEDRIQEALDEFPNLMT